jgi:hypothetical protein
MVLIKYSCIIKKTHTSVGFLLFPNLFFTHLVPYPDGQYFLDGLL